MATLVVGALVGTACQPVSAAPTTGVNDWNCRPSGANREPVIMLHGMGANGGLNWFTKAPLVAAAGYCVFTPTYGQGILGVGGLKSMRTSAQEVSDFVDKVRATTGAAKVNLVGHSEGTTVSAYYMKFLGGNTKVANFVGFGANYQGTTMNGVSTLVRSLPANVVDAVLNDSGLCEACNEYLPPSQFLTDLNAGGVTRPGPRYTNIVSKLDTVVVPYTSGIINEPGVTNIVLQDHCAADLVGHIAQAVDPNVTALTIWALNGQTGPLPACVPFVAPL